MLGTLVNALAIIFASLVGLVLKGKIPEKYSQILFDGLAVCILVIGIMTSLSVKNSLLMILSIVLGSLIGQFLHIEENLNHLSHRLENKFIKPGDVSNTFTKGFVNATILYCVGSMAIVGSLQSGLSGDHTILFSKSVLDGVTAILFSSQFGIGVLFSAIPVFIYQGIITLCASLIKGFMTQTAIADMSAVGGILIICIGINMLKLKKISVANMLPAVFIPIAYYIILGLL